MAMPGIIKFTPENAEIISDILEDKNYIRDISEILQEEFTSYGPDICDDLANRILKLQEGENISDILVANGPGDGLVSQETEGKIKECMRLMRHFLMVHALNEPDHTLSQRDEKVQRMTEAKKFLKKSEEIYLNKAVERDWVRSFPRRHVQVTTYEKMLDEVRTFLSDDVQENQVPVVIFLGHGMDKSGELCFANSQPVDLTTAFNDICQSFGDVKSKFLESSLRIVFTQCFAHKIDDGKQAGQLQEKNGTEVIYFTHDQHPGTASRPRTKDRPTEVLAHTEDISDIDLFIPENNYYMETYLNRLVKLFEGVYGKPTEGLSTRAYAQMLMRGDSLSLPIPLDKTKDHTVLMKKVSEQRANIKAFLHVVCSPNVTSSSQGRVAVRQAKALLEKDCYWKTNVLVSSLKDLCNKLDKFLTKDGAGKSKHVPTLLVCAEGKRGSNGKLERILFGPDKESQLVEDVFTKLCSVYKGQDSLRVAFICYEEEDQTDSATQQSGSLLYTTNSLVQKTTESTHDDLMKHAATAVGPGPLNK